MQDSFNKNANTRTIDEDGNVSWRNAAGELHRDNDLPAVELICGTQVWYQNGKYHREGGPACLWLDGTVQWCQHGVLHREDGPAETKPDGTETFWLRGQQVTEEDIKKIIEDKRLKEERLREELSAPTEGIPRDMKVGRALKLK